MFEINSPSNDIGDVICLTEKLIMVQRMEFSCFQWFLKVFKVLRAVSNTYRPVPGPKGTAAMPSARLFRSQLCPSSTAVAHCDIFYKTILSQAPGINRILLLQRSLQERAMARTAGLRMLGFQSEFWWWARRQERPVAQGSAQLCLLLESLLLALTHSHPDFTLSTFQVIKYTGQHTTNIVSVSFPSLLVWGSLCQPRSLGRGGIPGLPLPPVPLRRIPRDPAVWPMEYAAKALKHCLFSSYFY